ncbi:MAG: GvpL/GvpF family gas vesicle protein [Alphaproteobacteria bacterium]
MMMLYVYGIVGSPSFDAVVSGHEGAGVFPVRYGDVAAAASALSRGIAPEPQNVRCHEQVLEALMQQHAVLPLRFGTLVPDGDALRDKLRRMYSALTRDLTRLGGKVEFALRVTGIAKDCPLVPDAEQRSDGAEPLPPGKGYLLARAERLRERSAREDIAKRVEHMLRPHLDPAADDAVWEPAAQRCMTLCASYLVGRSGMSRFVDAVDDACGRYPELNVTCTGPWAPYSFVTARPDEAWQ